MAKKALVIIIVIILLAAVVTGFLVYDIYFKQEIPKEHTSSSLAAISPGPSRCSSVAQSDTYVKPDFSRLKEVMAEQPIVKDVPEKGLISLRFFHFTDGCRIWDKSYILNDGQIKEEVRDADIQIWLHSDYVDRITENNFCDIIKESRENGDLGQWSEVGEATLLWRYKGMLKYKECLGIKLSN